LETKIEALRNEAMKEKKCLETGRKEEKNRDKILVDNLEERTN